MDVLTPEQRYKAMAANRSKDTRPEKEIRSELFKIGFRFRKNDRRYPGTPDIVFPHYHAVIFVNGCFWHAHILPNRRLCLKFRLPQTNTEYWKKKLLRNRERDRNEVERLISGGWRVGIVWECHLTGRNRKGKVSDVASQISCWLEEEVGDLFREF